MLISLHTTHSASGLHPTAQRQAGEAGGRPATGIMPQTRIKRDDTVKETIHSHYILQEVEENSIHL